jgi:hypothetical protein
MYIRSQFSWLLEHPLQSVYVGLHRFAFVFCTTTATTPVLAFPDGSAFEHQESAKVGALVNENRATLIIDIE